MSNGISRWARTIIVVIIVGLALVGLGCSSSHSGRSAGTTNTRHQPANYRSAERTDRTVDPPSAPVTHDARRQAGSIRTTGTRSAPVAGATPTTECRPLSNGGGLSLGDDN